MQVIGLPHDTAALPRGESALYLVNNMFGGSLSRYKFVREQTKSVSPAINNRSRSLELSLYLSHCME